DPKQTKPGMFTLATSKTVKTPMMSMTDRMNFADLGAFTLLEIPYTQHEQSMIILLPKKQDGLPELEKQFNAANLTKWLGKRGPHQVDLKLPRFKMTAEFKLNDVLSQMGMKDAFVGGKADFTGVNSQRKLYLSAVLHKAFVDVNEAGTEAAAS